MSDRMRIGAGVAVVAVAVVLFIVLSGGDDDSSDGGGTTTTTKQVGNGSTQPAPAPAPAIPVIRLRDGEPVGGPADVEATSGDRVRFRVVSDTEGDVHVHGYDIEKSVKAGGSVTFDFPADLEGGYEIELHQHDAGESPIGELKVQPG
jgi:hypothetical protein